MRRLAAACTLLAAAACASSPTDLRRRSDEMHRELDREAEIRGKAPAPASGSPSELASAARDPNESRPLAGPVAEGAVEFDAVGVGEASRYERRIDAERRAEEDALAKAMRRHGVDVYYGFSDLVASDAPPSVARYLWTMSRGAATWERASDPECETLPSGTTRCRLRLRGRIVFQGSPDPAFRIRADGPGLGLSQPAYREGDAVRLRLRLSRDARLYLLSVDEDGRAYALLPNRLSRENLVRAGEDFVFPAEDSGIELKAALPEGRERAVEALHAIALDGNELFRVEELDTRRVGPFEALDAGAIGSILGRLASLPRRSWTMTVLPYTILENKDTEVVR